MSSNKVITVHYMLHGKFIEILHPLTPAAPCISNFIPGYDALQWIFIKDDKCSVIETYFTDEIELPWLPDMSDEEFFQLSLVFEHDICIFELRSIQEYFGKLLNAGIGFSDTEEANKIELTVQY